MSIKSALLLSPLLILTPSSGAAQKRPEKIRVTPQSTDGVVLVRVPAATVPYVLVLKRAGSTGFGSRVYVLKVQPGEPAGFKGRTLKPGRYRFTAIVQQRHWSLGFGANTAEFEIAAGRVSYLGKLNAEALLRSLQMQAIGAGKQTLVGPGQIAAGSGGEDATTEQFSGREPADVAEARAFSTRVMGALSEATQLAPLLPVAPHAD